MDEMNDNILTEWLEQESNCYKHYMKLKGFIGIVRTFKAGHEINFDDDNIKESCGVKVADVRNLLVKLGKFRKFTLNKLFILALGKVSKETKIDATKTHFFIDAGSTNVTSDYDITISGPYCSLVIEYMFEIYYEQFGTVLPIGFDSNLYPGTASYTTVDGLHPDFSNQDKTEGILNIELNIGENGLKKMLLPMVTNPDQGNSTLQNYQWACSKLYDAMSALKDGDNEVHLLRRRWWRRTALKDGGNEVRALDVFESFLAHGKIISETCRAKFCKRVNNEESVDVQEIESSNESYAHMWTHCKTLDAYYREGLKSNLPHKRIDLPKGLLPYVNTSLGYSNLVSWLCSEAYYSSFTVYAIVVSLQLGYNGVGFIKDVWLVAVIENLADLIKHMLHTISHSEKHKRPGVVEEVEYKKMYITYSKYYYRIYYCLTKYEEFTGKNFNVGASVKLSTLDMALARRKDFDIKKADENNIWGPKCLNIKNIKKPREWLEETTIMVMEMLNDHLQPMPTGKDNPMGDGRKRRRRTKRKKRRKSKKKKKQKEEKVREEQKDVKSKYYF